MKWIDKITEWENGIPQSYPDNVTNPFFYETSKCDKNLTNAYKEKYIQSDELKFKSDFTSFNEHVRRERDNMYSTKFFNLSKDTLLVIPMPRKGKDFSTIKTFIDNASLLQQKHFWKAAATAVKNMLQKYDHVYISTHGLGVPYFHLRINSQPKYYQTKSLI